MSFFRYLETDASFDFRNIFLIAVVSFIYDIDHFFSAYVANFFRFNVAKVLIFLIIGLFHICVRILVIKLSGFGSKITQQILFRINAL